MEKPLQLVVESRQTADQFGAAYVPPVPVPLVVPDGMAVVVWSDEDDVGPFGAKEAA